MQTINEVAEACAVLRKEFSENEDFREAFIASVLSGMSDVFSGKYKASELTKHKTGEVIAKRIMDVD